MLSLCRLLLKVAFNCALTQKQLFCEFLNFVGGVIGLGNALLYVLNAVLSYLVVFVHLRIKITVPGSYNIVININLLL